MILSDWLLRLAVTFTSLWLLAFPLFVGYLIYRPFERHVEWLRDQARSARTDETRAHYMEAAREYQRGRGRAGCLFALFGAGAALIWIWYVAANWHAIGRAIRDAADGL